MAKRPTIKEVLALVQSNKETIKKSLYVIGAVALLYLILIITTAKPQIPADIKATIDSLSKVNQQLLQKQKQLDSTVNVYKQEVEKVDFQIDNIKEKTTIVREYYHEVGQQAGKYTPTQIDSFFKARYNY